MKKYKIGILGGTFNPIHTGHLILAENAYDALKLDKVYIMPTGVSYLKDQKEIVSAKARMDMVRLAIEDNEHFDISTYEVEKGGNTYTYETLSEIKNMHNDLELYFILGADSLFYMENWVKPEVIFEKATIVVAPRNDMDIRKIEEKALELMKRFNGKIEILRVPNVDISSSMIRERIKKRQTVCYYIPKKVEEYIAINNMYTD